MRQKQLFIFLLTIFSLILVLSPLTISLNDLLTKLVENLGWYRWIQSNIVPWEIKFVGVVVRPLGVDFVALPEGFRANGAYARLTWNCLGWQSLLFLLLSMFIGYKGTHYSLSSKAEAVVIGILGTFLVNVARMSFTVLLLVYTPSLFAVVFHDYLAAVMTISWLAFFWWFSYAYVLEETLSPNSEA